MNNGTPSSGNDEEADEPVGYKRPPRHTRFRKGRSGNPRGRPKRTPNFKTALDRAVKEEVIVNEAGKRTVMSKLEAAVKQLVNKAVSGDPRAREQLLRVLPLVDPSLGESEPEVKLEAADEAVMRHAIARIRRAHQEDPDDETQSE